MRPALMLLAMAAPAAGCAPDVPDEPTWRQDVRPIVLASCTRCHSPPQLGGAPATLRLDRYEAEEDRDGTIVVGAREVANQMAIYVQDGEMPPDFPLLSRQRDIIGDWADSGAPEGPPVDGNRPPTMELLGDFEVEGDGDGDVLVADYRIEDADSDLVTGTLVADPDAEADGDEVIVTYDLFSGRAHIAWDVSAAVPGTYRLRAEIEDGSAEETVELGSVEVAP